VVKNEATLNRRDVVAGILSDRDQTLVVTGLGSSTWDVAAAGDNPNNFYLWGGMGGAAVLGLGLALAQPERRVLVITGDGEFLLGLGSLATIAVAAPANLAVLVIDNEHYGETGMQESHTASGVDLVGMASAAGWSKSTCAWTESDMKTLTPDLFHAPGPVFAVVKVNCQPVPLELPMRNGTALSARFRQALLGDAAFE